MNGNQFKFVYTEHIHFDCFLTPVFESFLCQKSIKKCHFWEWQNSRTNISKNGHFL